MKNSGPTICDLAQCAGEMIRSMSASAGLKPDSAVIHGVASGVDVALTLIEESSCTSFCGLSPTSAERIVNYFHEEANRCAAVDIQLAFFYQSWASVLTAAYIVKKWNHELDFTSSESLRRTFKPLDLRE